MDQLTRRKFIERALALSAGVVLIPSKFAVAANEPWPRARGPRKRVIVLGAGLAGLSAAYELVAAGHDVTLLEARPRAGGRVYTLREPFPDGLYTEVGATRISDTNDWVLKYVSAFGLFLEDFKPSGGADIYHVRGRRLVVRDENAITWPLALTEEERRLGLSGMRAKYIRSAFEEIGNAGAPDAPPSALARYDSVSYSQFLQRQGASPDARLLLTLGAGSNENHTASALMRLRAAVWRARTQRWTKIRGGNDQLPKAFAATLADRIHYKSVAVRVEQSAERVRVIAVRNGSTQTFDADYLVCTLPLPVLKDLEVRPALSTHVRRTIGEYGYGSATKVFLQTRSRFWERQGLSGFAVTDRPSQEVWNLSATQSGGRGLLVVYTTGNTIPRLAGRRDADRVTWAAHEVEHIFPGIRHELENGVSYSWDEDPWARAAFPQPHPGQLIDFLTVLRQPIGRMFIAGDHASAWPAWMQGALESGNHAARLIDAAS